MINSLSQFNINKFLDSFPDSRRILIAYSGGIDSSALLHLLCSIRSKLKQALEVIYIDHGLQKESNDWGEFCRQECIKYNVPFTLMKINESCPENLSVEGWARDKRYSLISKLVKKNDILFSTFPKKIKALQWHSYEVKNLENKKDITLLASSSTTKYQIFKYQKHAYGIQFHIEIKDTTVGEWGCVPEYKSALEKELGEGALEKFDADAKNNMSNMNNYSKILYENFKKLFI